MSQQCFFHIDSGRTWWVLNHTPGPLEPLYPIVILPIVSHEELTHSVLLFDFPLLLCHDNTTPEERQLLGPTAKTTMEVFATVAAFRAICQQQPDLVHRKRYAPNLPPPPPVVSSPPPVFSQFNQHHRQTVAMAQQQQHDQTSVLPGTATLLTLPYNAVSGKEVPAASSTSLMSNDACVPPPPPSIIPASPSEETLCEAQPLDLPQSVPANIMNYYMNPATTIYLGTLQRSHTTVWLRGRIPSAEGYNRPTKPGGERYKTKHNQICDSIVLITHMDIDALERALPIEIFDRPLCTFFLHRRHCGLFYCDRTHRYEETIRMAVAYQAARVQTVLRPVEAAAESTAVVAAERDMGLQRTHRPIVGTEPVVEQFYSRLGSSASPHQPPLPPQATAPLSPPPPSYVMPPPPPPPLPAAAALPVLQPPLSPPSNSHSNSTATRDLSADIPEKTARGADDNHILRKTGSSIRKTSREHHFKSSHSKRRRFPSSSSSDSRDSNSDSSSSVNGNNYDYRRRVARKTSPPSDKHRRRHRHRRVSVTPPSSRCTTSSDSSYTASSTNSSFSASDSDDDDKYRKRRRQHRQGPSHAGGSNSGGAHHRARHGGDGDHRLHTRHRESTTRGGRKGIGGDRRR